MSRVTFIMHEDGIKNLLSQIRNDPSIKRLAIEELYATQDPFTIVVKLKDNNDNN